MSLASDVVSLRCTAGHSGKEIQPVAEPSGPVDLQAVGVELMVDLGRRSEGGQAQSVPAFQEGKERGQWSGGALKEN